MRDWGANFVKGLPQVAPPLKSASVSCARCQIMTIPGPLCSSCTLVQQEKSKKAQEALNLAEKKKQAMKGPLPNSFMVYLTKWLEVASGHRVFFHHSMSYTHTFHVFKCTCGQNFNVGADLFYNVTNPAEPLVPSELQDWVKEHRHVCKDYTPKANAHEYCVCGWAKSEHSQYGVIEFTDDEIQQLMEANAWVAKKLKWKAELDRKIRLEQNAPKELEVLEQPSGRKFRI